MATRGASNDEIEAPEPPRSLVIHNEQEAFRYLQQALSNELGEGPVRVEFDNWPILTLRFEGEGYDSTITPQIAEALIELQHAMNRTYARFVRSSENAKVLTQDERQSIQFKAKVERGSSLFKVDIGDFAQKMALELMNKMSGTELVIAILGVAVTGGALLAYKSFLAARSEDRKVDQSTKERVALSADENRRLQILADALTAQPRLKATQEDFDAARHEIVRSVGDASTLGVQGVELTKEQARVIALTPRSRSEDVQLNGNYRIVKLDWSKEDEVRISLYAVDNKQMELTASMRAHNLTPQNIEKLKACEWDRRPIYLSINATVLRGGVTSATIVGVEWPQDQTAASTGPASS